MRKRLLALAAVSIMIASAKDHEAVERIRQAANVFKEIQSVSDRAIPNELLEHARCLVIAPGVKKAGFILGAQYGKGIMTCQVEGAARWSGPSTIRIEGGSIGAQIGGQESDIILVVLNQAGAEKLMRSEFTLGGDISVAAGPVGREARASTDLYMNAQILSYSRARGVFAGISLQGSTLRADNSDNQRIYGKPVEHQQILLGKVPPPDSAQPLYDSLNRYFRTQDMPARTEGTSPPKK